MMKEESVSGVHQLRSNVTRKFCADVDALKAEEWKRRRLLRLEQVRQQSKDIASDIRRKVFEEKNHLLKDQQRKNEVAVTQWKEAKLNALQSELSHTLTYVGSAHKEAEYQEANREVKTDHLEAADRRGREAILRLRLEEQARKQAEDARRRQRQHVRSIEEARSAVLVSLPVPKTTLPAGHAAHVPKVEVVPKKKLPEPSTKQWPSKTWSASVPLGVTPADVGDTDSHRIGSPTKSSTPPERVAPERVDSHSSLLREQDKETVSVAPSHRQGISCHDAHMEGTSSGSTAREYIKVSSETAKKKKEPKEVELYDCTNGSHVQYVKPSVICKSVPAGPVDGLEAAEACVSASNLKRETSRASTLKRIERGKEAIKRVQTRREHQALLSDLAKLVRQQAALRSLVPSKTEKHSKIPDKYFDAVSDLLKERFEENIATQGSKPAGTQEIPREEAKEIECPVTSTTTDGTIIDICSQNEASKLPDDSRLKEDRAMGERDAIISEVESTKQEHRIGVTISEAESSGKETTEERDPASFFDETTMSTCTSSDAPKLNLALWTSRSPSSSNREEKTLTPSDKTNRSVNSLTKSDSTHETLTPPEKQAEEIELESSYASSMSGHDLNEEAKASNAQPSLEKHPKQRSNLTVKSHSNQRQKTTKTIRNQKHLASGDYVASQAQERRTSLENKSPEITPKVRNFPKVTSEVDTPQETPASEGVKSRTKKGSPLSSGSSYMGLPNKLLSAITEDLRCLLNLTRGRKGVAAHSNPVLAHYINRLLDMSRQSVERLNVMTSEVCTPPSALFRSGSNESSSIRSTSRLPLSGQDEMDGLTNFASLSLNSIESSSSGDNSALVTVMQQCCARISSLSQMIEQVRQDNVVSTPEPSSRSPSLHLGSTAYLSPPFAVEAPSKIVQGTAGITERNNLADDTYSAAITRLVSEIRQQLAKHTENPFQIPLHPSQSSAENTKSASSNELSTIPEQDLSSVEWPSVVISSETCGSSEEVEKEFSRMGLGWAGTTLRKTKEACHLDSNSSSDILEFSALSLFGSYSHSTPIKTTEGVKHFNS